MQLQSTKPRRLFSTSLIKSLFSMKGERSSSAQESQPRRTLRKWAGIVHHAKRRPIFLAALPTHGRENRAKVAEIEFPGHLKISNGIGIIQPNIRHFRWILNPMKTKSSISIPVESLKLRAKRPNQYIFGTNLHIQSAGQRSSGYA